MKKIFLIFSTVFLVGCTDPLEYDNSIFELGNGFSSKEMCTCMFVLKHSEKHCLDFVKLKQVSPKIEVDAKQSLIKTSLFYFWKKQAKFLSASRGCQIL